MYEGRLLRGVLCSVRSFCFETLWVDENSLLSLSLSLSNIVISTQVDMRHRCRCITLFNNKLNNILYIYIGMNSYRNTDVVFIQ
jgi:hypothetical protein